MGKDFVSFMRGWSLCQENKLNELKWVSMLITEAIILFFVKIFHAPNISIN